MRISVRVIDRATGTASQGGHVYSEPKGIACTPGCRASLRGKTVELTAMPKSGYRFYGWTGGWCTGEKPVCRFTMRPGASVDAIFQRLTMAATEPVRWARRSGDPLTTAAAKRICSTNQSCVMVFSVSYTAQLADAKFTLPRRQSGWEYACQAIEVLKAAKAGADPNEPGVCTALAGPVDIWFDAHNRRTLQNARKDGSCVALEFRAGKSQGAFYEVDPRNGDPWGNRFDSLCQP